MHLISLHNRFISSNYCIHSKFKYMNLLVNEFDQVVIELNMS